MKNNDWTVLKDHPELIDTVDTSEMTGYEISLLLRYQPQLKDKLDVSKMGYYNIKYLSRYQPQFKNLLSNKDL